ncbi:MAG: alpha/beta hydrolase-fold protein [Opitutaceae bacterium]
MVTRVAFKLRSPETNTEYSIFVAAAREPRSTRPRPAMLLMDGDNQFRPAITAYRKLRRARRIPAMVLVGVGYGAGYGKPANRRGRDYTPTAHHYEPESGGADAFLKFLEYTLWPELVRRYALHPKIRGIGGHSLGSLLVLHALWRLPLFFTHFLASAPSIWWDNRSILKITAKRRTRAATLPAKLFLSAGERDTESMLRDLALLERQLVARPFRELSVTSRRFPQRNHYNVMPDAFREGLIALFSPVDSRVKARSRPAAQVTKKSGRRRRKPPARSTSSDG